MKRTLVVLVILLITACGGPKRISNTNLAYRYSPGLNFIFPAYSVFNITDDTSRVFFSVNPSELLFKNNDSLSGFSADFSISFSVYQDYDSKIPLDTGVRFFHQEQVDDTDFKILNYFDIKAGAGTDYLLQLVLTDLNRSQAVSDFLYIDRTGVQPANDFMAIESRRNGPLVPGYCDRPSEMKIHYNREDESRPVYLRYFKNDYPLATPPFSRGITRPLSYTSDSTSIIDLSKNNPIKVTRPGIYHFQFDTLVLEGFTFFYFDTDFPRLTSAQGLIESIRYLTTREEYDKIMSSKDKKTAVDDFWLKLGGSRERARILIKSYYSRVQYANRFFTSYVEGWKTDKGLIYVIFGPPSSVYSTNDSESWNYSSNSYYGSLTFTFDKIANPFTRNDFKLRRNEYYEIPWYKAVDSWRNGRVVNENY